jgi:hypothetical protein
MKFVKLFILSIFVSYAAKSQEYTPVKTPLKWLNAGFDSLFVPSHDTIPPKDKTKAWLTVKDTAIYVWKGNKWVAFSGGATGGGNGNGEINSGTIPQLRALSTTTGRSYTATGSNGGSFTDIGLSDGQYPDDGAIYLITANNKVLKRDIDGPINVLWFGAKGDSSTNNITAFNATVAYVKSSNTKVKRIYVPTGNYFLSSRWVVDAGGDNIGIKVEGDAEYASNLIFTGTDTVGLQHGSAASNTLGGGVKNIAIIAKPTIDAFVVASSAPYAAAWNIYENIRIYNARDGVSYKMNPANETSCFRNVYTNIHIAVYSRIGFSANGSYNDHYGLFITQPNGETNTISPNATKGALNLGLKVTGSNQSVLNSQFEDQIYNLGSNCLFDGITVENMLKYNPNPICGPVVFFNAGTSCSIRNFRAITTNNHAVNTLMLMYGPNTSLDNISYANPGNDVIFQLTYPIMLGGGSGTIKNTRVPCTYMQNAFLDPEWGMENVLGSNGIFTTPAHLTTTLNDVMAKGKITTTRPQFRGGIEVGDYNVPDSLSIEASGTGGVFFKVLGVPVGKITSNNIDVNNGGVTLQYKSTGTFQDGMTLDRLGKTTFANTVSGKPAVADTQFVTRKQNTDSLDARFTASSFILRNAGGTGDSIMKIVTPGSHVAMKRLSITGASKTVTDTSITWIIGANGTVNFTGNGSTKDFTFVTSSIPWYTIDSKIFLTPVTATGTSIEWVEKSTESFTIHFLTAPSSGSKAIDYDIMPATISP